MKKQFLCLAAFALSFHAYAADNDVWMRYPAISPDGSQIAFSFKGDIYTVLAKGGRALQITTNSAHDTRPIWSPDGKQIAFASDRMGSMDLYIVSKDGGIPQRLTTHSGNETPLTFKDNKHILFQANILPSTDDMQFASGQFPQVYEVSTTGGRPVLFSSLPMEDISFSADGKSLLYHDKKGYEDPWRKHHTSSITRDIWLCNLNGERSYQKLSTFNGEDRNPVWASSDTYYYLSEQNGSFNVFKANIKGGTPTPITKHTKHPVRFLSRANNGTLCYGYDGGIYTLKEGSRPQKVSIDVVTDKVDRDLIRQIRNYGATQIALSAEGKEIAFILRGDVYVTSTEYKTTKQITDTPEQERNVDFAPDGRSLVYASERNGLWQVYQASIVDKEEKLFTYATDIKEERLTKSDFASFQPQYSPDGKEVAFLENRTTLRVINLASKKVRTVMDGKFEYSYSDGDQWYQWSPDSRWLLTNYIGIGGWNNKDVALVNASGNGEIHNLTQSGYSDSNAKWVLDGKAMIWRSDRAGYRSHGSWGAHADVYIMFFEQEAYERFLMTKEELALAEEADKAEKEKEKKEKEAEKKNKKDKDKDKGKDKADDKKKEEVKALTFDLDNCRDRIVRLTKHSSQLGDAVLSKKGDKLYYQASFEGGSDLWCQDLKENSTKIVLKGIGYGQMIPDKKGENFYLCSHGGIKKVTAQNGSNKSIPFEATFNYKPYEERQYIFDHAWQQVKDKFYVENIHGIDWEGYRDAYRRFLPSINNNYDFQELLSELLGELNGSHTGARYYGGGSALPTANLGVFFDDRHRGNGLRIKEILPKSPFAIKKCDVTPGCIIEAIDGTLIEEGMDYFPLLEGKVGKNVLLRIYDPINRKLFNVTIKAISSGQQNALLYKRWVDRNRRMVDELSGGRIAYVHVQGMDSPSFRTVFSELLSEKNRQKEAVIVDTRHNGGGWLHDDLVTLLNGKEYQRFVPRGQYIGSDPHNKWLKPSCVLVCEDNYSNAHGFPWVYKELGIGKLIGAPVPGTMTAVWWESQIDPSIVFGIPQVGCKDMRGQYLENSLLTPDIEVYNKPEDSLRGIDTQLETAVKEMLKTVNSKK
ncbi:MAG: PD40 domain-containing protein [Bacteroidaceae bacterium]|nr:PD40 domain-containing protein [Bacteroidaceae bacterium]